MDAERWMRVKKIVHAALAREEAERPGWLDRACGGDTELRREVESLLEQHHETFMETGELATSDPSDAETPNIVGETLGHYEIIEPIGQGGMGFVYRGRDTRLSRPVAIKVMAGQDVSDSERFERFTTEAQAASALNHPNIVTIHDVGSAGPLHYIAMELVEGTTLRDLMREEPLRIEQVLSLACQLVDGLAQAHDAGIVHRDLKPENLMLRPDGFLKILDFGLAKVIPTMAGTESTTVLKANTEKGTILGTVAYMSPEQASGGVLSTQSDQFSLGCILYELVSGALPFERGTTVQTLAAIIECEPLPLVKLTDRAPPSFADMVGRLLSKDPAERFPTTRVLATRIRKLRDAVVQSAAAAGLGRCPLCDSEQIPGTFYCTDCRKRISSRVKGATSKRRRAERREATVLCGRLSGYAAMVEVDPDVADRAMQGFHEEARTRIRELGGHIVRLDGETLVAVFGVPSAREDDARRAVQAAAALRSEISRLSAELDSVGVALGLRVAVDTNVVVAQATTNETFRVAGTAVERAVELLTHAGVGEILLSPTTHRMVEAFFASEPAGSVQLRGSNATETVTPHRVLGQSGHATRLDAAERTGLSAYSGRGREYDVLRERLERAVRGDGQLVTVMGSAGAGKSRLLYEFRRRIPPSEATTVTGRCQSFGSAIAYLPFIEAVRDLLELEVGTGSTEAQLAERIRAVDLELTEFIPLFAQLLSIKGEIYAPAPRARADDFRFAMEQGLSALFTLRSKAHPLILFLEDWHWADEASRGALRQLTRIGSAYPLLLVVTHRPELVADWDRAGEYTPVNLGPLDRDASIEIMKSVFGATEVAPELASLLYERTEGNPFFIEEMCRSLQEGGKISFLEGRVEITGRNEGLQIPATVNAVLQTRLDRLTSGEKSALQRAAVVGREFSVAVLERSGAEPGLSEQLEALQRADLVRQTRVLPEATYRFKHALTHDVAYESLLINERKTLHREVALAIETLHPERLEEHLDVLAHHFVQGEVWHKAAEYSLAAARRAKSMNQHRDALAKLEETRRSLTRLPDTSERRAREVETLLEMELLADTLAERDLQQSLLEEAERLAREIGDGGWIVDVTLRRGDLLTVWKRYDEAAAVLNEAVQIAFETDDLARQRTVLQSLAFLQWNDRHLEEARLNNEKALAICRRLGDAEGTIQCLSNLAAVFQSIGDLARARVMAEEAVEICETLGDPELEVGTLATLAGVYGSLGRGADAIATLQRAERLTSQHRVSKDRSVIYQLKASVEWRLGEFQKSLESQEQAINLSRKMDLKSELASSLRSMGRGLLRLGRQTEAVAFLTEAARVFGDLGEHENEMGLWMEAASTLEHNGRLADAREIWSRVQRLSRATSDPRGEMTALKGMARSARAEENEEEASELLRRVAEIARETHASSIEADALNSLAILAFKRGAYDEAIEHYERAHALFRDLDELPNAGLVLNSLGVTLTRMGRLDDARRRLEEGISVHHESGEKLLEGHALAALGDVNVEAGNLEAAARNYDASLSIRIAIGDRRGEGWMNARLAAVAARRGDAEEARSRRAGAVKIARECADEELFREVGSRPE